MTQERDDLFLRESAACYFRYGDNAKFLEPLVATLNRPETARAAFVNVEGEEPIGQSVVRHRVPGVAPLAEKDKAALQCLLESGSAFRHPRPEQMPLGMAFSRCQIVSATLGAHSAIRSERNAEICPVHFLLDDQVSARKAAASAALSTLSSRGLPSPNHNKCGVRGNLWKTSFTVSPRSRQEIRSIWLAP